MYVENKLKSKNHSVFYCKFNVVFTYNTTRLYTYYTTKRDK
jgi:hypothetical protein